MYATSNYFYIKCMYYRPADTALALDSVQSLKNNVNIVFTDTVEQI